MSGKLERLERRIELTIWRFVIRDGRAQLRRLNLVAQVAVVGFIVPGILLMSWLMPGTVLESEQAAVIAMSVLCVPAFVTYGALFASRACGLMGRQRSIPLAIFFAAIFFAVLCFATKPISFPSPWLHGASALVLTVVTSAAALAYGNRSKNFASWNSQRNAW